MVRSMACTQAVMVAERRTSGSTGTRKREPLDLVRSLRDTSSDKATPLKQCHFLVTTHLNI